MDYDGRSYLAKISNCTGCLSEVERNTEGTRSHLCLIERLFLTRRDLKAVLKAVGSREPHRSSSASTLGCPLARAPYATCIFLLDNTADFHSNCFYLASGSYTWLLSPGELPGLPSLQAQLSRPRKVSRRRMAEVPSPSSAHASPRQ